MEFEENEPVEEQEGEAVEIYSKKAIFWFAFLLGPMFGSILLMLNLREVGYKRAANIILLFTILFDCVSEIGLFLYVKYSHIDILALQKKMMNYKPGDASFLDEKTIFLPILALALRLGGALFISQYFFKKYFPEDDYYAKSISNVLFISIAVWIFLQFIGLGGI